LAILTHYIPTKEWILSRNPTTKKGIIEWYSRELRALEVRRLKPIKRKFAAVVAEVDSETGERVGRIQRPKIFETENWQISEQDFNVYKRLLDERFQSYKRAHNERIRNERSK